MDKESNNGLTPSQAADVIRFFNTGETEFMHSRGWRGKIDIAQSALRTTKILQSLTDDGRAMLTLEEMESGLDYINDQHRK